MTNPVAKGELSRARQLLHEEVREDELQRSILDLAGLQGWMAFHVLDSRGSTGPGFPDLVLARAPRLLFRELKRVKGVVTAQQQRWLDELGRCTEVSAGVWRPGDWETIEEALRR